MKFFLTADNLATIPKEDPKHRHLIETISSVWSTSSPLKEKRKTTLKNEPNVETLDEVEVREDFE